MKTDRTIRNAELHIVKRDEQEGFFVEGYASTFEPYVLFSEDGVDYSEVIDRHAFDEADMSDVVFRIDHEGAVYARTSNGLIELSVDDKGLFNRINLGMTEKGRELWRDIEIGNYPKMSFAFTVKEDAYDRETHRRTVLKVGKVFDVSAVSFPANPTTSLDVATRSFFDGEIEKEQAERLAQEKRQAEIESLKERLSKLKGETNGD